MDDIERQAERHIRKATQTVEYLETKITDRTIPERKRDFMRQDKEALEFLLEYAKEALAQRGIRV